ncbi:SRPBCC domain-containing protein [Candidatus Riflebacteria bacterium]
MAAISAKINIKVDAQTVWKKITELDEYPYWDPGIKKVGGTLGLGQQIQIYVKSDPENPVTFNVVDLTPETRMVWEIKKAFGMCQSTRTFSLKEKLDGTTDFKIEEVVSGLLSSFMGGSAPDLNEMFQKSCEGLKKELEMKLATSLQL